MNAAAVEFYIVSRVAKQELAQKIDKLLNHRMDHPLHASSM